MAYGALGPQPHQIGNPAYFKGGSAGPKLVAILKPGTTSWTVPRASTYTLYVKGPGTLNQGGGLARKKSPLPQGLTLSTGIFIGTIGGNGGVDTSQYLATTISGGPINISVLGTAVSGGDVNIAGSSTLSGSDGSIFGGAQGLVSLSGQGITYGISPGGPSQNTQYFASGAGEILIVDETP